MNVPFIDFSEQYQSIKDQIDKGLKDVFEKGNFILGEEENSWLENQEAFYENKKALYGHIDGTRCPDQYHLNSSPNDKYIGQFLYIAFLRKIGN